MESLLDEWLDRLHYKQRGSIANDARLKYGDSEVYRFYRGEEQMKCFTAQAFCVVACVCLTGCGGSSADPECREIAEWVLEAGGTLVIVDQPTRVTAKDDLPEGDFAISEIDLQRAKIDATGLEKLISLTHLKRLGLYQTNATDKWVDTIVRISSLSELELSYTLISDKGLAKLRSLDHLKKLYLYGTAVTDEGIEQFHSALSSCQVFR